MKEADKEVVRLGRRRVKLEEALAEKAATADHSELTSLGTELNDVLDSLEPPRSAGWPSPRRPRRPLKGRPGRPRSRLHRP